MIPLVALFICFLAIAGVGVAYAYNSTIQIDDNPVNEQYFTLDYTAKGGNWIATVLPADAEDMTITTSVTVEDNDNDPDTEERTFNATINKVDNPEDNTAQFTRVFYVKLTSNMDADQEFVITGEVITNNDTVLDAIFGDCTNAFKMYDSTDTLVDMGHVTANHGTDVYKVVLTVPIKANVDVKTIPGLAGASAIVDASTLNTALSDLAHHTFTVKMKAELP